MMAGAMTESAKDPGCFGVHHQLLFDIIFHTS